MSVLGAVNHEGLVLVQRVPGGVPELSSRNAGEQVGRLPGGQGGNRARCLPPVGRAGVVGSEGRVAGLVPRPLETDTARLGLEGVGKVSELAQLGGGGVKKF